MPTFTITSVRGPNPWTSQHGPMNGFVLQVDGESKPVHINQKPETPAPTPGQSIDLELTPHPTFDDALKGKKPSTFSGGGGGGRPRDPKESAAIVRQHSQNMALRTIELGLTAGIFEAPTDGRSFFALVAKTADWFDRDVAEAKGKAA